MADIARVRGHAKWKKSTSNFTCVTYSPTVLTLNFAVSSPAPLSPIFHLQCTNSTISPAHPLFFFSSLYTPLISISPIFYFIRSFRSLSSCTHISPFLSFLSDTLLSHLFTSLLCHSLQPSVNPAPLTYSISAYHLSGFSALPPLYSCSLPNTLSVWKRVLTQKVVYPFPPQ